MIDLAGIAGMNNHELRTSRCRLLPIRDAESVYPWRFDASGATYVAGRGRCADGWPKMRDPVAAHVNFGMQTPTCLGDKEGPDVAKASSCVRRVAYLCGASSHRAMQLARD